jgi:hypothetical protein
MTVHCTEDITRWWNRQEVVISVDTDKGVVEDINYSGMLMIWRENTFICSYTVLFSCEING